MGSGCGFGIFLMQTKAPYYVFQQSRTLNGKVRRHLNMILAATLGLLCAACDPKKMDPVAPAEATQLVNGVDTNVTAPFYNSQEFTPLWLKPNSQELESFHTIPDFSFTNQDGKTVTNDTYKDKIYVASFFFTTCPGVCSPVNIQLLVVQNEFADDDQVRILSHSIMPGIDSVPALKKYATERKIISGKWDLVTGDRYRIFDVAQNGYFASDDLGNAQVAGDFQHTEDVLLIDQNRHIRGIYNGLSAVAMFDLIADIKKLKAEQN
jgi:protein SCO1